MQTAWWLAARGLEEKGYWSPKSHVTWRKVKPLRMSHGRDQTLRQPFPESERWGRYTPAFPLYSPSDLCGTSHSPNPSGNQLTQSREAQPAGTAPPPQPRIQRYSVKHECIWMQMRSSAKQYLQISTYLISKCQMLLTRSICSPLPFFPHISPSQTTRNRENGYYISKVF